MKCHVLLFAQLRETVGRDKVIIELADGATIADALDAISNEHEGISAMRGRIAVAVDERYQPLHARLREGCTIALIPPVSGG